MSTEPSIPVSRIKTIVFAASACVLAALLLLRVTGASAQVGSDRSAGGGMVTLLNGYCLMTSSIGSSEHLVLVLDGRSETLLVYKPDQATSVQLLQRLSMPRIFVEARSRYQGRD